MIGLAVDFEEKVRVYPRTTEKIKACNVDKALAIYLIPPIFFCYWSIWLAYRHCPHAARDVPKKIDPYTFILTL